MDKLPLAADVPRPVSDLLRVAFIEPLTETFGQSSADSIIQAFNDRDAQKCYLRGMILTHKKPPPTATDIRAFKETIDFELPVGFWDHFTISNGFTLMRSNFLDARFMSLNEMVEVNNPYERNQMYQGFFIIGDDGAGTSFAINNETSELYAILQIGEASEWVAEDLNSILLALND